MTPLHVLFIDEEMTYTGEQLQPHWAYRNHDLLGDSAVAFIGPCDVQPEYMKDLEDLKEKQRIYSERMLHFIVEHFDTDLSRTVLRQHILMAIMAEELNRQLGDARIRREGSDLYDGDHKVTVSIASVSPVSTLIHAGINISSRNTPVPTRGLEDFGIEAHSFAEAVLQAYAGDCEIAQTARCKVRGCE